MNLRIATLADLNLIKELRLIMLNEVADSIPDSIGEAIQRYLEKHLNSGACLCALMEIENKVVAKAMLCVYEAMPDEMNVSGKYARLFSVYTLPEYRGHGYMENLLRYLLDKARSIGVEEVFASAEELATPLYQRLGFSFAANEMSFKF